MFNILEPELVWVENRCYRFCDKSAWSQGKELGSYVEETYDPDYLSNDEDACDIEIVPIKDNRYKHSFYVNSHFYRFIIGAKGATLKRLTTETKTIILVPKPGDHGDIIITGPTQRAIINARRRIDLLIETSRSKLEFTHFVCIPGNTEEIKQNFNKFKEDVLKTCNSGVRIIREELFSKPEKLHLTIIMLVLLDEEDRRKAIENLEDCKNNIIMPTLEEVGPITIQLRGVEIMNDDPSQTRVLYIRAHDESGYLQSISDRIADHFIEKGLSRRQYNKVKLHMTAMNAGHLENEVQGYRQMQQTFDATNILKTYADTFFGMINFSTVHLSLRHSEAKDGFYQSTSLIQF